MAPAKLPTLRRRKSGNHDDMDEGMGDEDGPPRRIMLACSHCRQRKIKCNGLEPCQHCTEANPARICEYVKVTPQENAAARARKATSRLARAMKKGAEGTPKRPGMSRSSSGTSSSSPWPAEFEGLRESRMASGGGRQGRRKNHSTSPIASSSKELWAQDPMYSQIAFEHYNPPPLRSSKSFDTSQHPHIRTHSYDPAPHPGQTYYLPNERSQLRPWELPTPPDELVRPSATSNPGNIMWAPETTFQLPGQSRPPMPHSSHSMPPSIAYPTPRASYDVLEPMPYGAPHPTSDHFLPPPLQQHPVAHFSSGLPMPFPCPGQPFPSFRDFHRQDNYSEEHGSLDGLTGDYLSPDAMRALEASMGGVGGDPNIAYDHQSTLSSSLSPRSMFEYAPPPTATSWNGERQDEHLTYVPATSFHERA